MLPYYKGLSKSSKPNSERFGESCFLLFFIIVPLDINSLDPMMLEYFNALVKEGDIRSSKNSSTLHMIYHSSQNGNQACGVPV